MKIPLSKGRFVLVDKEDYNFLTQWKWHTSYYGYAERRQHLKSTRVNQKFKMIKMHRLLMNVPDGKIVDHINGDKLDNRRVNLRICTQRQNSANQLLRARSTSGFKGVTWHRGAQKWASQIKINYKHHHLGLYKSKTEAALAYDRKAIEVWGEYARTNII